METFPDDATGDALRRIQQEGSDFTKPMEMDFFVAVPSEESGIQVALQAKKLGFETSVKKDGETEDWTCYCTISLIVNYSEVVRIEEELSFIAQPYGGYIDGFGTFGNV